MEPGAAFKEFLGEVESGLLSQLGGETASENDSLTAAARHLCLGGGAKRARPVLVKVFGNTLGVKSPALVDAAIAAELIHSASLLHDDVVDAGMYRRGRPTVNARWGNIVAVMSGDLLLSGALLRLSHANLRLTQTALETVAEMTKAAIHEVEVRGNLELSLEDLARVAEGKTRSLFGWCGKAAAILAGNSEAEARFDAFGRRIGVAFQMADDIRDVTGTDEGKPPFADIASKSPSLPLLLAARRDPALVRRLKEAWAYTAMTPERVKELGTAVLCSGVVDEAIERMTVEVDAAVDALGPYAQSSHGAELVGWARKLAVGIALKGAA